MNLISTAEAAKLLGITQALIGRFCEAGRIPGSYKLGKTWAIPSDFKITPGSRGPVSVKIPTKYLEGR